MLNGPSTLVVEEDKGGCFALRGIRLHHYKYSLLDALNLAGTQKKPKTS